MRLRRTLAAALLFTATMQTASAGEAYSIPPPPPPAQHFHLSRPAQAGLLLGIAAALAYALMPHEASGYLTTPDADAPAGGGGGGGFTAPAPSPGRDDGDPDASAYGCAWGDRAYGTCH